MVLDVRNKKSFDSGMVVSVPGMVLLGLVENVPISRQPVDVTFSWLTVLVNQFERKGFVRTFRVGRVRILKFTPLGRRVRASVSDVFDVLEGKQ